MEPGPLSVVVTTTDASVAVVRAEFAAAGRLLRSRPVTPAGVERRWTFSPAGFEISSDRGVQAFSWAQVARFSVRAGHLVVTVAPPLLFVLPVGALTGDQHRTVQQWWVAARLAGARGERADLLATPRTAPGAVVVRAVVSHSLLARTLREAGLGRLWTRLILAGLTVLGLVGLIATVLSAAVTGRPDPFALAFTAVAAAGVLATWLVPHHQARRLTGGRSSGVEQTWVLDADGVAWQRAGAVVRTRWPRVSSLELRSELLVARLDPGGGVVVPAAGLGAEDLARVAGFARSAGVEVSGLPRGTTPG